MGGVWWEASAEVPPKLNPKHFLLEKDWKMPRSRDTTKIRKENPTSKTKAPLPPQVLFLTGQGYRELELGKNKGLGRMWGQGAVGS